MSVSVAGHSVLQGVVLIAITLCLLVAGVVPCSARKGMDQIPDTGGHSAAIRAMDVSDDGRFLVTGSQDKTLRVWDLVRDRCVQTVLLPSEGGQQGAVFALDLVPDGRLAAVGGWMGDRPGALSMGQILLVTIPEGRLVKTLKHASSPVFSLAFSPDGRLLASGSGDGTVRIWNMDQGVLVHSFAGHEGAVRSLAWIDPRRLGSGGDDGRIVVWGLDAGGALGVLEGHTEQVACLAVSPQGTTLVSGGYDKSVREWDIPSMRFVRQLTVQEVPILSLAFHPAGSELLVTTGSMGEGNARCLVLSRDSGKMRTLFLEHDHGVDCGRFVPGTPLAATAGADRITYVWNTRTGKIVHRFAGSGRPIASVHFGGQGDRIFWTTEEAGSGVPGRDDALVRPGGVEFRFDENGYPALLRAEIPPDAKGPLKEIGERRILRRVGAETAGSLLEVYEEDRCLLQILRNYEDGKEHVAASLTPDGNCVVSGGGYGSLAMYRIRDREKVLDFKGHTGAVTSLAISPDGTRLVSGSLDQTVRLWDLTTGALLVTVLATDDQQWVAWIPAGYIACSPSGDALLDCVLPREKDGIRETVSVVPFGSYLYRPDIVGSILTREGGDSVMPGRNMPVLSPEFLDSHRPPEIEILSPMDGDVLESPRASLLFAITPRHGLPDLLRVRVNGRRVITRDQKDLSPGRNNLPLTLAPGENTIGLVAVGEQGTRSEVEIRTTVSSDAGAGRSSLGDLYYLGVGVGDLKAFEAMNLPTPSTDVNMVGRIFKTFRGKGYVEVHTTLVSDDYGSPPTREHIDEALDQLEAVGAEDTVILMLVGQGVATHGGRTVLLPRDARPDGRDGYLTESVIEIGSLLERLAKLRARTLVLCDLAHAGPLDMTRVMRRARDLGVGMLSATRGGQRSGSEYPGIPCSPFAYALFKGLGAGLFADTFRDGRVHVRELAGYVQAEVQALDRTLVPSLVLPAGYGDFFLIDARSGPPVTRTNASSGLSWGLASPG
jgi:WD40 repeat protein